MQRFFLNPDYADFMAEHDLANFSRLLEQQQHGELIEIDKGRTTHKIRIGEDFFYLKCVDKSTPRSALESLLHLEMPHHYCWREMQQVFSLQSQDVAVMEVVAAGETVKWGVPQFSFIVVKEVCGESLDAVFSASLADQRLSLLQGLGDLHGQLHKGGFFAPARMKDIIVNKEGKFVLIDRETRKPNTRKFTQKRALDSLHRTMSRQARDGTLWTETELNAYLQAYLDTTSANLPLGVNELKAMIL